MKTLNTIVKILTALAAVAGAVYVIATYGDKIVAWAKELWAKMPQCPCCEEIAEEEVAVEAEEAPVAEADALVYEISETGEATGLQPEDDAE